MRRGFFDSCEPPDEVVVKTEDIYCRSGGSGEESEHWVCSSEDFFPCVFCESVWYGESKNGEYGGGDDKCEEVICERVSGLRVVESGYQHN